MLMMAVRFRFFIAFDTDNRMPSFENERLRQLSGQPIFFFAAAARLRIFSSSFRFFALELQSCHCCADAASRRQPQPTPPISHAFLSRAIYFAASFQYASASESHYGCSASFFASRRSAEMPQPPDTPELAGFQFSRQLIFCIYLS